MWSPSKTRALLKCPYQKKFLGYKGWEHEDTTLGSMAHMVLERLLLNKKINIDAREYASEKVITLVEGIKYFYEKIFPLFSKEHQWFVESKIRLDTKNYIEPRVTYNYLNATMGGVIDFWAKKDNTVYIIDYKSHGDSVDLLQLEWYVALCYYRVLPHPIKIFTTNFIISTKKLMPWLQYSPVDLPDICQRINSKIKDALENVKKNKNTPTPGEHCEFCSGHHYKVCEAWIDAD